MRVLFCALALVAAVAAPCAVASDESDAKQAAAQRLLRATDPMQQVQRIVEELSRSMPLAQREVMRELFSKYVRRDVMEGAILVAMQKHFTVEELNALAAFNESPAGRSASAKMPGYTADMLPIIQAEVRRAVEQMKADLPPPQRPS